MRPLLATLAAALLLPALVRAEPEDDGSRAIIEKAIKALGGEKSIQTLKAVRMKVKGKAWAGGQEISFAGDGWMEAPGRNRLALQAEISGMQLTIVQVLTGDKGWVELNGMAVELDEKMLRSAKEGAYADRVSSLFPLLKDKDFSLKALGESKVKDQEVVGVKVSAKDKPDVELFFDKTTGLLAKVTHKTYDPMTDKEVLQEITCEDYVEPNPLAADEAIVQGAGLPTEGAKLLEFFRKQTLTDDQRAKIKKLIAQLGDDTFKVREDASKQLVTFGPSAIPFLKEAAKTSMDAEVVRRATLCLEQIERGSGPEVAGAVARLIAARKPDGAVDALLAFLTKETEEAVALDVKWALVELALKDGKPHPALEKALDDKDPVRKAAAEAALGKDGGALAKKPGRRLLITGVKRPTKISIVRDGEKFMEYEESEIVFFNKFENKLFEKPSSN